MPGRLICFVCGSPGAELSLRTKAHERAPYFPFLEHHDPPKGSRLPSAEGIIDSCRVCYAFLTQQWETYERSKTPAIKRLYWLKRADNGHFTGAEMRLQGEYIAQIMGLQYQPGLDCPNSPDTSTRDGVSPLPYKKEERRTPESSHRSHSITSESKVSTKNKSHSNVNQGAKVIRSESPRVSQNNVKQKPSSQNEGILDLTIKKEERATPMNISQGSSSHGNEQSLVCYVCTKLTDLKFCKCVNSCPQPTSEPFFPVLQKLPCPSGAIAMNHLGQVVVCLDCKTSLYQQWQAYELSGVRSQHRVYKLHNDLSSYSGFSSDSVEKRMSESNSLSDFDHYVCYLCGKSYHEDLIRMLYTVPPKELNLGTLFFPFVRELRRPHGAQPLKADGTVMSCRNCYAELYQQWQYQEVQQIPVYHRKYSLSFLSLESNSGVTEGSKKVENDIKVKHEAKSSEALSNVNSPLNIQITEAGTLYDANSASSQSTQSSLGLLAIADKQSCTPTSPSKLSSLLRKSSDNSCKTNPTVPHPLEQATSLPQKLCFLCGEKCMLMKAHILYSYPVRHDTKLPNSQTVPFFPFLANRSPALGAEGMSEDGTVISCNICFHSLIKQWTEFEDSKSTTDNNRWLRKYSLPDYVCYVCAKYSPRENVKTLQFHKFPFLKEHKYPLESLILDGGSATVVCKSCVSSLDKQYSEYERLKVPMTLRKYNWVQSEEGTGIEEMNEGDDTNPVSPSQPASPDHINVDDSSHDEAEDPKTTTDAAEYSEGLPQGSKPPPLNMINPVAAKLPRNTATVPPLNQVSPSNGVNSIGANAALNATRTSSFAAALRKLAHQAKDPEEGSTTGPSSQPGSSSTSPRAPTPKRGPPPLVYNSHSSSLTSPPVVTIAPTQSHTTNTSSAGKQSSERAHSAQSSSSMMYEGLNLKQERVERPQSTQSNRDEDRNSAKDLSSSRRLTPHSVHSSVSPATAGREEGMSRGFQPYRAAEELRHQIPPSAFGLDPATAAAYSYSGFLPPHAFSHPAFRFDDPLLLERYRMMQQPYMPFPHPSMLPPPGVHPLLAQGRYPAELLHQQFPFVSQSSRLPDHLTSALSERRIEEERLRELEREKDREREREREKEKEKEREAILQREKERAKEREKEYDKERLREQYYSAERGRSERRDRGGSNGVPEHGYLHRPEDAGVVSRYGSITHGTTKDHNGKEGRHGDGRHGDRISHDSHHNDLHHKRGLLSSTNVSDHTAQKDDKHSHLMNSSHRNIIEQKSNKSMESSFFRPFDTNLLHNGFHGSQISDDKYSNHKTDRSKSDATKSKHQTDHIELTHSHKHSQESMMDSKHRHNHLVPGEGKGVKHSHSSSSRKSTNQSKNSDHSAKSHHVSDNHSKSSLSSGSKQSQYSAINLNNLPLASTLLFQQHDFRSERAVSVVSRLDLEEKKRRQKRLDNPDFSDSEEDDLTEEVRNAQLQLVTQGPPLQLDESREKMKFLKEIGLTSYKVKQELEFEKYRRRRRFHKERSVSPIELDPDVSTSQLDEPARVVSDDLCREKDFPDKCSFLSSFNLGTIESGRKKELEKIRLACEADRCRRLSLDSTEGHSAKRKLEDTEKSASDSKRLAVDRKSTQSRSILFPGHKDYVCREFVEEFHQSVLQSTRQTQKDLNHHNSGSLPNETGDICSRSGEGSKLGGSHDSVIVPRWPGVVAIMDSYQRHSAEQNMEHRLLKERCRNLQNQNKDLNRKSETLYHKMKELMHNKKVLEKDKTDTQSAIDSLKLCIKDIKR